MRGRRGHVVRARPAAIGALLAGLLATASGASAGTVRLSVEPTMTRGPETAPVTIIEFSDYQ